MKLIISWINHKEVYATVFFSFLAGAWFPRMRTEPTGRRQVRKEKDGDSGHSETAHPARRIECNARSIDTAELFYCPSQDGKL